MCHNVISEMPQKESILRWCQINFRLYAFNPFDEVGLVERILGTFPFIQKEQQYNK